ncbi:hypothetical protein PIB30_077024 [Stylosanthes scabra]|uniref:E3 ubiquitin-protein ligase RMA n=2 Tax=Stylosanthes scabra TaxID=79078 RepID=A0ABU6WR77_9FABA|nr:hypothetical protein [Stylosanthes scabra]
MPEYDSLVMAVDHYISQEWKTIPNSATETENCNGCFDCNICLDFAREPVVTLCGHLYCWPCIYKWLHVQSDSLAPDEPPQCPVCKAGISHTTMVPLYGRGQAPSDRKALSSDFFVPPRPPASRAQSLLNANSQSGQRLPYRNPYQGQYLSPEEEDAATLQLLNGATMNLGSQHTSLVGMFGEMFYGRVFGNPGNLSAYPNSYQPRAGNNSRLRRQEMEADKCLHRVSIFLFCFFLLCLIVF